MRNITTLIYVPHDNIQRGSIYLDREESKHLTRVLRVKTNDHFIYTDGAGKAGWAVLEKADDKRAVARILEGEELPHISPELPIEVSVGIGVIKPANFEIALKQLVQLGVKRIIPLICRYSDPHNVTRLTKGDYSSRLEKIMISGMKSSLRTYLPKLDPPVNLIEYLRTRKRIRTYFGDPSGLPYVRRDEDETVPHLLLVGPEGGFSHREIETLRDQKALPLNLGRTRLRAETAAISITVKALTGLGLF